MSYSKLATVKILTNNCTKPRNHKIDTITIHHMAGNLSVETCGRVFQNPKKQGSSNYGVGTDGRIACYVEEENRAWTSSNGVNDHRAITIEVANDGGDSTNWHVSDKALDSTIKLVADICKRNNISKLIWSNNKSDRVNHKNGCNMTVHRDFASTACPGPYLYSQMNYIATKVNELLGQKEESTTNVYVVQKGDTLSKIAAKYNVKVEDIISINNITNKNVIYVGQKLVIPTNNSAPTTTPTESKYKQKKVIAKAGLWLHTRATTSTSTRKRLISNGTLFFTDTVQNNMAHGYAVINGEHIWGWVSNYYIG